jgi:uncharacterized membrane protein YfcA
MEIISSLDLSLLNILIVLFCGLLIGMSKVGVPGVFGLVIPALAFVFGARESTGLLLPMLIVGDFFGVAYYRRHANWQHLIKILPWAVVGLILALWIGNLVNDKQFKSIIAILVFLSIGLMLYQDKRKEKLIVPEKWWFAAFMGILGGFATMIGNVAGPVFAIYLLAMHLQKNNFIGTGAWFFLIINITKFPLQLFVWHNISIHSLTIDLIAVPAIVLGAFLGLKVVKIIPEKAYRGFVIAITAISAFLLLI